MSKTIDKAELAKEMFRGNPDIDTLHITSDGQGFAKEQDAESHCSRLENKKIDTFERNAKPEAPAEDVDPILSKSVKELPEALEDFGANDLDQLKALLAKEEAGLNRKGALAAINSKIEALEKLAEETANKLAEEKAKGLEVITGEGAEGTGTGEVTEGTEGEK